MLVSSARYYHSGAPKRTASWPHSKTFRFGITFLLVTNALAYLTGVVAIKKNYIKLFSSSLLCVTNKLDRL
jgi:hypothetical protein